MRAWIIGTISALAIATTFATTAHARMPGTAEEWMRECPNRERREVYVWCYGFMVGLHEGMAIWNEYSHESFSYGGCPPVKASNEELFEVTLRYIRAHPTIWHEFASKAILAAWWDAYPCSQGGR
jgi:hypothetical protein